MTFLSFESTRVPADLDAIRSEYRANEQLSTQKRISAHFCATHGARQLAGSQVDRSFRAILMIACPLKNNVPLARGVSHCCRWYAASGSHVCVCVAGSNSRPPDFELAVNQHLPMRQPKQLKRGRIHYGLLSSPHCTVLWGRLRTTTRFQGLRNAGLFHCPTAQEFSPCN